jgi:hypothetical protein
MGDPGRWIVPAYPRSHTAATGQYPVRSVMGMPLLHALRFFQWLVILTYGIAVIASFTALGQATYRAAL